MSVQRSLVAAYACRCGGSRLYGKPMQNLALGITVLDSLVRGTLFQKCIDEIVLGIAEGDENLVFKAVAAAYDIPYIVGDEHDVLGRLIQCADKVRATDIFRVTSECPFVAWECVDAAWQQHLVEQNDITVIDHTPSGTVFEIYTVQAMKKSHEKGGQRERSEYCSLYAMEHAEEFKIGVYQPEEILRRVDYRLTVDYPEDLILCREIFASLSNGRDQIPLVEIIKFLDENPELHNLVEKYHEAGPYWTPVLKR
ncbi:cytidylyltransferase domain-containing protein [Thalassospira lucentensis]|uniref:cytidylyltransferase domain-containing protein n=1 Tax=Thalassospira lucentensis TaxID=168935 RepID=UPI003D2C883B